MSSHRHLERAGIREREPLSFSVRQIEPNGISQTEVTAGVEGFAGGGFNGSVLLLPNSVIKTGQPGAVRELLRQWNWPVPYPSRSSEVAAQLDYVSGRLLHKLVPAVTSSKITVPEALGYTQLPGSLGFGQVIERVRGRGPTFLDDGTENQMVRDARRELWEFGVAFGVEHAAQVHPDNPFGKPNVWISEQDPDGQQELIWLDYLPAFRHTGLVKPFFYFAFHKTVRAAFNSDHPTFNRINTETMRSSLREHEAMFSQAELGELEAQLVLYDELWANHTEHQSGNPRSLFVKDAEDRQIITAEQAEKLQDSTVAYAAHRSWQTGRLALRALADAVEATPLKPVKILWDKDARAKAGMLVAFPDYRNEKLREKTRFFTDSVYRRDKIIGGTLLRGYKQAHVKGQVSKAEYDQALAALPAADLNTYTLLQLAYFGISRAHDVATVPLAFAAATSSRPAEAAAGVVAFNILSPGVVRSVGTLVIGRLLKKDLKRMALVTAAPIVGGYSAVPYQIKREYSEGSKKIMHYNMRSLAAKVSSLRPHGGWGSDLEEKIWNGSRNFVQGRLDTPKIDALHLNTVERAKRYPPRANFSASPQQATIA